jgi:E3 ubiquitin-protein ligase HECTD2
MVPGHFNYLLFPFRLEVGRLRMLVRQLTQFVTIRQFPPADRSLPPLSKSKWWIPAAARVLALLSTPSINSSTLPHVLISVFSPDAANNGGQPALLHYSEFYNSALDHVDLMQEYWKWQAPSPERAGQFSVMSLTRVWKFRGSPG